MNYLIVVPVFVEEVGGRPYDCASCCLACNSMLADFFYLFTDTILPVTDTLYLFYHHLSLFTKIDYGKYFNSLFTMVNHKMSIMLVHQSSLGILVLVSFLKISSASTYFTKFGCTGNKCFTSCST